MQASLLPCFLHRWKDRALALALAAWLASPLSAQEGGQESDPRQIEAEQALRGLELEKIRKTIELSAEREAAIAAEIQNLEKDQASLGKSLVAVAAKIQNLETSLSQSERRLAVLAGEENLIRTSLAGRQEVLGAVLAAAQRIGRNPPPALIVRAEDALGAVRSAIVLDAILPEVRLETEALAANLKALTTLKAKAEQERSQLMRTAMTLREEETRLALLLEEKQKARAAQDAALQDERLRASELGARAHSLEELIAALGEDLERLRAAREAAQEAAPSAPQALPPAAVRLRPAMPFTALKGLLSLPVRGVVVRDFGETDSLGAQTFGVTIATRADARVTAPADGTVIYAGEFRTYGQLLILDAGDGYHIVLAGMRKIDVDVGQFVLAGEPVGQMGSERLASAAALDIALSQPVLYIEFRNKGTSIDPGPWWAGRQDRKVEEP